MTMPFTRGGLSTLALALALALPAASAHAQRVTPARIDAVPRVELGSDFDRLDRYNNAVRLANEARAAIPKHRMRQWMYALATTGTIVLAATQFQTAMEKMDEGDGTGWETPGMIASLSVGGALLGWMKWLDARSDLQSAENAERAQLQEARRQFPDRDPAGGR